MPPHYRKLRTWVTANDYRPLGPTIEWYPNGFDARDDGRSLEPVSLKMPIEAPGPLPASAGVQIDDAAATTVATSVSGTPIPSVATPSRLLVPRIGTTPTTKVDAAPPMPPPQPAPPVQPVDDNALAMAVLLEGGNVDAIANRLMPRGKPIPADLDLWLGQLVFRVSAAGKGVARTYPGEGAHVAALATAIKNRYRTASSEASPSVLEQVVVRVPRGGSAAVAKRQSVLRDLDRLLGRIAVRAVSAAQAQADLASLLERAAVILGADRAKSSDG